MTVTAYDRVAVRRLLISLYRVLRRDVRTGRAQARIIVTTIWNRAEARA